MQQSKDLVLKRLECRAKRKEEFKRRQEAEQESLLSKTFLTEDVHNFLKVSKKKLIFTVLLVFMAKCIADFSQFCKIWNLGSSRELCAVAQVDRVRSPVAMAFPAVLVLLHWNRMPVGLMQDCVFCRKHLLLRYCVFASRQEIFGGKDPACVREENSLH